MLFRGVPTGTGEDKSLPAGLSHNAAIEANGAACNGNRFNQDPDLTTTRIRNEKAARRGSFRARLPPQRALGDKFLWSF